LAYFRFGLFEPGEFLRLPAISPTHFVGIAESAGEAFAHGPSSQTQFIFHPRPRDGFPFADLFEGVANFFRLVLGAFMKLLSIGDSSSAEMERGVQIGQGLLLCLSLLLLPVNQIREFLGQESADACSALGGDTSSPLEKTLLNRQCDALLQEFSSGVSITRKTCECVAAIGKGVRYKSEGGDPLDVAWASRPLARGHPARAFLAGAGRSHDSGRDARATFAFSLFCRTTYRGRIAGNQEGTGTTQLEDSRHAPRRAGCG